MHPSDRIVPYCGLPPDPSLIWSTWRLDPLVLFCLFALFWLLARAIVRAAPATLTSLRLAMFASGWIVLTLALVSPLCPLSVALFSARASQHVVLTMIAAPLVAAGFAQRRAAIAFVDSPIVAAFGFAAVVWFWHAPAPYALTFESTAIYWTMHVTLFASAVWLWRRLLDPAAAPIETLLASLVSTVQMGFLGALITLAPHAVYAPHFTTTDAWALTPLQDQQLGGAIMWVFGCVAFLAASMGSLHRLMRGGAATPSAASVH